MHRRCAVEEGGFWAIQYAMPDHTICDARPCIMPPNPSRSPPKAYSNDKKRRFIYIDKNDTERPGALANARAWRSHRRQIDLGARARAGELRNAGYFDVSNWFGLSQSRNKNAGTSSCQRRAEPQEPALTSQLTRQINVFILTETKYF